MTLIVWTDYIFRVFANNVVAFSICFLLQQKLSLWNEIYVVVKTKSNCRKIILKWKACTSGTYLNCCHDRSVTYKTEQKDYYFSTYENWEVIFQIFLSLPYLTADSHKLLYTYNVFFFWCNESQWTQQYNDVGWLLVQKKTVCIVASSIEIFLLRHSVCRKI